MMKLFSILLTFFLETKTRYNSENLREAGIKAAERGRRLAFAGLFVFVATVFFLSAVLIAVIELGFQIDRAEDLSFTGLMVSASLLAAFGLLSLLTAWIVGQEPDEPPAPPPPPRSPILDLVECIAVTFLRDFQQRQSQKDRNS